MIRYKTMISGANNAKNPFLKKIFEDTGTIWCSALVIMAMIKYLPPVDEMGKSD